MKAKFILFFFLILTIGIFSCKKEEVVIPNLNSTVSSDKPNNMSELTSAASFSWQTVKNVKVKIQGSHFMTATIKNINGDLYFRGVIKPNIKLETNITIPTSINDVIVQYGQFSKKVAISNNTIDCIFDLNSF
ncbi:MAG: hypothetical protein HXX18_04845 [Bacteroidetes bacterium]|nr:hypothetical protein [Bacteroidota bacterium]